MVSATVILGCLMASSTWAANCKLAKIAAVPVSMQTGLPILTAKINGEEIRLIAHTGQFYSMLTPSAAEHLQLKTFDTPIPYAMELDGHRVKAKQTKATEFSFGGLTLANVMFLVGGSVDQNVSGTLGQNVLSKNDAEFNLSKGMINLMRSDGCDDANLAYWTEGTNTPYSVIEIEPTDIKNTAIVSWAYINGQKVFVTFDTGIFDSILSLRVAKKLGIDINSPGVTPGGMAGSPTSRTSSWIAPFASFKLGDEEIKNTHLRIADTFTGREDMIIGNDFFLSHHMYISPQTRRLFFSYEGGAVFNLTTVAGTLPATVSAPPQTTTAEPATVPEQADDIQDAEELDRRGAALAARGETARAIADLDRACQLAPNNPEVFFHRALIKAKVKQSDGALEDLDHALELRPDYVLALINRAQLRLDKKETAKAVADLDLADHAAYPDADVRLQMAQEYLAAEEYEKASLQLKRWTETHKDDPNMLNAQAMRCEAQSATGQEAKEAVEFCSSVLKRLKSQSPIRARLLKDRAILQLRLGDYTKSIDDDNESLTINPKDPDALYSRGMALSHTGKSGAANTDFDAARAINPTIEERFTKFGLTL